ncbi:MAG: hypothetical protein HY645_14285 [Acidobacteria bacterium]|nr:hypothetical protein [Acidobacteriota bacterium]
MSDRLDVFVSVVIPFEKPDEIRPAVLRKLAEILHSNFRYSEIVIVGSSHDHGWELVRETVSGCENARLLLLSRRASFHIKVFAGLETVIGSHVVVLPPDQPPHTIFPDIIQQCCQGYDILYGVNRSAGQRGLRKGTIYRWLGRVFHWYVSSYAQIDIVSDITDVRCISRRALNAITSIPNGYQHFRHFSSVVGFASAYFHHTPSPRSTRRRPLDLVHEGAGIVVENTTHPLKVMAWVCGTLALAAVAATLWVILAGGYRLPAGLSLLAGSCAVAALLALALGMRYLAVLVERGRPIPPYYIQDELEGVQTTAQTDELNVVQESLAAAGASGSLH